jgi:hypothetical protein
LSACRCPRGARARCGTVRLFPVARRFNQIYLPILSTAEKADLTGS